MKRHYLKTMAITCKVLGLKKHEWIYTLRYMAVSLHSEMRGES